MDPEPKHPVKTSEKTLRVVEELRNTGGSRLSDLADALDMGKSNLHSHLSTLAAHGYVIKDGAEYSLSLRFLEVGGAVRDRMPLVQSAVPEMRRLASETGELVNLLTEQRGYGVYLYVRRGENAVDLDTYPGLHTYLHTTALGKSIMAHLPDERVEEIVEHRGLPQKTSKSITTRDDLEESLDTIRQEGYARDDEERLEGLRCIAAPIVAESGVRGAISVAAPMSRMRGDRYDRELPDQVQRTANVIEINMQYS